MPPNAYYSRFREGPTGHGFCEILRMLILAENGLRGDAKHGAAGRFEQRPDVATILVIIDPGKFLPNRTIGNFLHCAFEYYSLVAFFRGNGAVTVAGRFFALRV